MTGTQAARRNSGSGHEKAVDSGVSVALGVGQLLVIQTEESRCPRRVSLRSKTPNANIQSASCVGGAQDTTDRSTRLKTDFNLETTRDIVLGGRNG